MIRLCVCVCVVAVAFGVGAKCVRDKRGARGEEDVVGRHTGRGTRSLSPWNARLPITSSSASPRPRTTRVVIA